ncbi:MAG: ABC transporter ATP-binding protein [bacterium]|nr:ABC transporter ATP-binding protein [bacterium]
MITYLSFINPFKRYPRHLILTGLATLCYVVFNTLSIWLIAPVLNIIFLPNKAGESAQTEMLTGGMRGIYDSMKQWSWEIIGAGDPLSVLPRLCIALIAVFLLKNIFAYLQLHFVSYVEQRMIKDLRDRVYAHVIRQPYEFYDRSSTGELMSAVMNDVNTLSVTFQRVFTQAVRDPITVVTLLIILFSISWQLMLAALVIVPAFGVLFRKTGGSLKRKSGRIQEGLAEITGALQETISGARLIKSSATEQPETERFESRSERLFHNSLRLARLERLASPLSETIGVMIIALVLLLGGQQVLSGSLLDAEDFIRFIVVLFSMLAPARAVGNLNNYLQIGSAAGARIDALLAQPIESDVAQDGGQPVSDLRQELRYENVWFRYPTSEQWVLHDVSLTIRCGERVALVGRSGSGKTTLANLLPRFYTPEQGRVLWDGVDVQQLDRAALRRQISLVSQDVFLFNESVRYNLTYGLRDVTDDKLATAMKRAQCTDFVAKLPRGLETIVGERGAQLSGGQKQRIAIARALLKDAPLLIFDEATSALDNESERLIQHALEELFRERTVIIIAHRLSSIRFADRVVVLDEGQIAVEGLHPALLDTSELYRTLTQLYEREAHKL